MSNSVVVYLDCLFEISDFSNRSALKSIGTEYHPNDFKVTIARQKLVNVFTANLLPFGLVDSPEFRDFVSYISSNRFENMPSRSLLTTLVDHVVTQLKLTVCLELSFRFTSLL